MSNSAAQNPANKVARNSGAGAGGVSEVVPTEAEARRGLEPLYTGAPAERSSGTWAALGAITLAGAGLAAFVTKRLRRPRSQFERLRMAVDENQQRVRRWARRKK